MHAIYSLLIVISFIFYSHQSLGKVLGGLDKIGYIILQDGDTINGRIDYELWEKSPKKILFKTLNESKYTKYLPFDIIGFEVAGRRFFSANVDVETSSLEPSSLSLSNEFLIEKTNVFIEQIILGEKSLFEYSLSKKKSCFYYKHEDKYELFRYKKYLNGSLVSENNEYRRQMEEYLGSSEFFINAYDKKAFLSSFKSYYERSQSSPEFIAYSDFEWKQASNSLPGLNIPNFVLGVVELKNQEVLTGHIHYPLWISNPTKIYMQLDSMNEGYVEYKVDDILSFSVAGRKFQVFDVDVLVDSPSLESMDDSEALNSAEINTERKKVFLEEFYGENKKLYGYSETGYPDSFYILIENEINLLEYKEYIKRDEKTAEMRSIENGKFRGQLAFYFKDCPVVMNGGKKIRYNKTDLLKYLTKYSDCINGK